MSYIKDTSIKRQPKNTPKRALFNQKLTRCLLFEKLEHDVKEASAQILIEDLKLVLLLRIVVHSDLFSISYFIFTAVLIRTPINMGLIFS